MNYHPRKKGDWRYPGIGMPTKPHCEICGIHRSVGNHTKCSKEKQARFAKEQAA